MPLSYLLLILMAFYGPNAELLGNIKLTLWQFQNPIGDMGPYATKVIILLAVDWTASIINIIVIRIACKINVFKTLKTLQQNFWHVFAASEAFLLMEASVHFFLFFHRFLIENSNRFSYNFALGEVMIWPWSLIGRTEDMQLHMQWGIRSMPQCQL